MLSPGTILQNRYRIVRQLGQGGMGAVYEAVDQRLDTTVALKETLFADERLRKQFEREARLLARLHHQALPRVSDHFNESDGQFLVMQYIAGDDLQEMLTTDQAARRSSEGQNFSQRDPNGYSAGRHANCDFSERADPHLSAGHATQSPAQPDSKLI